MKDLAMMFNSNIKANEGEESKKRAAATDAARRMSTMAKDQAEGRESIGDAFVRSVTNRQQRKDEKFVQNARGESTGRSRAAGSDGGMSVGD